VRKLFGNGRYANVAATLALFIALGGTSYAAITLPANSVSTKQIKKGAVTLNRLSSGAQHSLKGNTGARGPQGVQGPAGSAGSGTATTVLWATVAQNGSNIIARSSPGASSFKDATGVYYVTFAGHDLSKCSMQATIGGDTNQANPDGEIAARPFADGAMLDRATVDTFNSGGGHSDRPFYLTVSC
jgi:hypothetical protein